MAVEYQQQQRERGTDQRECALPARGDDEAEDSQRGENESETGCQPEEAQGFHRGGFSLVKSRDWSRLAGNQVVHAGLEGPPMGLKLVEDCALTISPWITSRIPEKIFMFLDV